MCSTSKLYLGNLNGFQQQRFQLWRVVLGTSSVSFYFVNKLQSKLSAQKLFTKSGLMQSLIVVSFRPFYHIYKNESCTNSLLVCCCLRIIIMILYSVTVNVLFTLTLLKSEDYLPLYIVPPWQNIMLIHIIEVFDVKRGLCLA